MESDDGGDCENDDGDCENDDSGSDCEKKSGCARENDDDDEKSLAMSCFFPFYLIKVQLQAHSFVSLLLPSI